MLRTSREPSAVWVLRLSAMMIATRPRAVERATAARTCEAFDLSGPSCRNPALKAAVSPVQQAKAVDLPLLACSLDQTLTTPTLEAPEAGERRMKGELYLIRAAERSAHASSLSRRGRSAGSCFHRSASTKDSMGRGSDALVPANKTSTRSLFPRSPLSLQHGARKVQVGRLQTAPCAGKETRTVSSVTFIPVCCPKY
jgi:hypothetical protein